MLHDAEGGLLRLYLLVILGETLWDGGLRDTDGNDFDTWSPSVGVFLKHLNKLLIQLIKLVNEDLLEGVLGAELVDLVMDLVVDPRLVIIHCVVLNCHVC